MSADRAANEVVEKGFGFHGGVVNSLFYLRLLPRNTVSWLVGRFAEIRFPPFVTRWLIRIFASNYNIDLAESEKELGQYATLGEFFVRRLKVGSRPVSSDLIICPADGTLTTFGQVSKQTFHQIKGISYPLERLLGDSDLSGELDEGMFATVYLAPHNYHRVHSPVDGVITRVVHIPGTLWPVNAASVLAIPNLFAINERVIVEIESPEGRVAVVLIGATNVGSIRLAHHPLRSNSVLKLAPYNREPGEAIVHKLSASVQRGNELGAFHFGSTVVVLFDRKLAAQAHFEHGAVKMGQSWSRDVATRKPAAG